MSVQDDVDDVDDPWNQVRAAVRAGLIPDYKGRCQWDTTDYLIAADFLEEHHYPAAGAFMRDVACYRQYAKTADNTIDHKTVTS